MSEFEIEVRNAISKLTSEVRGLGKGVDAVAGQFKKASEAAKEMTHEDRVAKYAKRLKEAEENAKALAEAQERAGKVSQGGLEAQESSLVRLTASVARYAAAFAAVGLAIQAVGEARERVDRSVGKRSDVSLTVGDAARRAGIADPAAVAEFSAGLMGPVSQEDLNRFAGDYQAGVIKSSDADFRTALQARALLGRRGGPAAAGNLAALGKLDQFRALDAKGQAAVADEFTARSGGVGLSTANVTAIKTLLEAGATLDQGLNIMAAAGASGKADKIEKLAGNASHFGLQAALAGVGASGEDRIALGAMKAGYGGAGFPRVMAPTADRFTDFAEAEALVRREAEVSAFAADSRDVSKSRSRLRKLRADLIGQDVIDRSLASGDVGEVAVGAALKVIPGGNAVAADPSMVPPGGAVGMAAGPFGAGAVTPEAWAALWRMMMDYFKSQDSKKVQDVTVGDE